MVNLDHVELGLW